MKALHTLVLGGILGAAALLAPSASAADFGVSVGVGVPYPAPVVVEPAPVIVDGGYDSVWVEPVYRTEFYFGSPRTVLVTPGYYNRVYRSGYYRPSSGFYIGGSFRDRDHDRDHDYLHHRDKPGRYR